MRPPRSSPPRRRAPRSRCSCPRPSVSDVEAVADAGQTMPPKSTFFFPKILDGMVFNQLDPFEP